MKYKPWPIVCLAYLHFFAPFVAFYLIYLFFDLTPFSYFKIAWQNNDYVSLLLHLAFPLAGYVIYQYKTWSLPVFWALQLAAIIFNVIFIFEAQAQKLSSLSLVMMVITIINVLITTYFLLPVVRRSFFDQSLHWWLVKKRYLLELPAKISKGQENFTASIVNISEGGILFQIADDTRLKSGDKVLVEFNLAKLNYQLLATIVQYHAAKKGFGASFAPMSSGEKSELMQLLKALQVLGLIHQRDQDSRFNDFRYWLGCLIRGKGLTPAIESKN